MMAITFETETQRCCDIVMKGGVTSGVVYPLAICKLAQIYTIKSIGGTSVGAIAASLTAAAEYRRRKGVNGPGKGYEILSTLPAFFETDGNLRALFAADRPSAPLLAVALNFVGSAGIWTKAVGAIRSLLLAYWLVTITTIAALVGIAYILVTPKDASSNIHFAACAILLLLLGFPIVLGITYILHLLHCLNKYDFGWCHGHDAKRNEAFNVLAETCSVTLLNRYQTPPLTDWLEQLISQVAGRGRKDPPLTFRDLWESKNPSWLPNDGNGIDFRVITTCLTLGLPFELPFSENAPKIYFTKHEMSKFFGTVIVDHLINNSGGVIDGHKGLYAFPPPGDIPLVVAVRLSMSFPILFSAIPLWTFDRGRKQRLWFSDGGLSSNFPIHLFDSPLPRWPTFALDLLGGESHKGLPKTHYDAHAVFLESDVSGAVNLYNMERGGSRRNVMAYLLAIIDSMRTWQDTLLGTLPGNRGRTVGIRLGESEGGLNLNMNRKLITTLINLGDNAGDKLIEDFASSDDPNAWKTHRWTRYLATFGAASRWLKSLSRSYQPLHSSVVQASYEDVITGCWPLVESGGQAHDATACDALAATESVVNVKLSWSRDGRHDPKFEDIDVFPPADFRMRPGL